MDCRACCKLSKMSKNSPNSFVVRENRRLEVGKNSLLIHGIFILMQVANSNQPCLYLITGHKTLPYSTIKCKSIGLRLCSGHGRIAQKINPKIAKRQHCHFCQNLLYVKLHPLSLEQNLGQQTISNNLGGQDHQVQAGR